jgi:serine/threonine-protein kinase
MKLGPFEILETLGGGGSGIVYRARHEALGRIVALKQLNRRVQEGDRAFERFLREAQLMGKIRSDHIATLYSFQVIEGRPVLEMECLEHGLEDLMNRGPLDLRLGLRAVHHVLLGLKALHGAGIVHRDLKPANVLRDEAGRFKISDFGLSVLESDLRPTLTAATVRYVAPESVGDAPRCDFRSDLYSVGMIAYEALLGPAGFHNAFPELTPAAAFGSKWLGWLTDVTKEATPLHVLRPDVPVAVSQFVARLMAKDPERRYASAEAALEAMQPLLDVRAVSTPQAEQAGPPPPPPRPEPPRLELPPPEPTRRAPAAGEAAASRKRRFAPRKVAVAALGATLLVALVSAFALPRIGLARRWAWVVIERNAVDGLEYAWIPAGQIQIGCDPAAFDELRREYVSRGWSADDLDDLREDLTAWCREDLLPRRPVHVPTGFWIGRAEVPVAAFERFLAATGRSATRDPDEPPLGADFPALVNWDEASAFCQWAGGRLPTESQWEFSAASGRDSTPYPWGGALPVCDVTSPNGAHSPLCGTSLRATQSFPPTAWGLYDVSGNASEWAGDWRPAASCCSEQAAALLGWTSTADRTERITRGAVPYGESGGGDQSLVLQSLWARYEVDADDRAGFRCIVTNLSPPAGAPGGPAAAPHEAEIVGKVADEDGGSIPGAVIRLLTEDGRTPATSGACGNPTGVSGSYGEFCFSGLPAGNYQVRAELEGFESVTRRVTVAAGEGKREDVSLVASILPPVAPDPLEEARVTLPAPAPAPPPPPRPTRPTRPAGGLPGGLRADGPVVSRELEAGFTPDPEWILVDVSGTIDLRSLDLGDECRGYAPAAPTLALDWSGDSEYVRFYVTSSDDTVLAVRTPGGTWLCNDDTDDADPEVGIVNPRSGRYLVWVAGYDVRDFRARVHVSEYRREP